MQGVCPCKICIKKNVKHAVAAKKCLSDSFLFLHNSNQADLSLKVHKRRRVFVVLKNKEACINLKETFPCFALRFVVCSWTKCFWRAVYLDWEVKILPAEPRS